eukprot:6037099-Prymnesium_polylepis.1
MIVSVSAIGKLGTTNDMAALAIRFYLTTTAVAATTGVVLFNVFRGAFAPMLSDIHAGANSTELSNCTAAAQSAEAAAAAA